MRVISMPVPGNRFRPDLAVIAALLPDVTAIDISFIQPTATNPYMMADVAKDVTFIFYNGKVLNVEGYMLWKFRDMIPEALGSEEHGYNDTNMYSTRPTEILMTQIRQAYDCMFLKEEETSYKIRSPLSAKLDLKKMTIDASFPAEMSDDVFNRLQTIIENNYLKDAHLETITFIQNLIKTALQNKYTALERYDKGNGMLAGRFVQKDWEPNAIDTMTINDFVNRSSPNDGSKHLLEPYNDFIINEIQRLSDKMFIKALHLISQQSPSLLQEISNQLQFVLNNNTFDDDEAIHALSISRDNDKVVNLIFKASFPKGTMDMYLSSFLKININ